MDGCSSYPRYYRNDKGLSSLGITGLFKSFSFLFSVQTGFDPFQGFIARGHHAGETKFVDPVQQPFQGRGGGKSAFGGKVVAVQKGCDCFLIRERILVHHRQLIAKFDEPFVSVCHEFIFGTDIGNGMDDHGGCHFPVTHEKSNLAPAAEGAFFTGPKQKQRSDVMSDDGIRNFFLLVRKLQPGVDDRGDPGTFGGHAYDSIMMVTEALKKVGPDKAKIRDYIENNIKNWAGTGGIFNMSKDDHCGLDKTAFEMVVVKNGDWSLLK